ncbi:hypothetical protein N431DRAFT_493029 [Stipitochalara longipes BDJ]|nr:hypothetical protein N431DRAFT_493029 [Stipitochalara longipes BDJ]
MSLKPSLALGILLFCGQVMEVNTFPFEQFYPEYGGQFAAIIASNCSSVFHQYKNAHGSAYATHEACHLVVDCILSNSRESTKANMASADVVLGLLPTILALLGSTTPELSLLSSRRPLLAFLLSIGAPAVSPVRAAVTNVWTLSWQLGQKTLVGISCGFTWLQMFWVGLAAVVHLLGTLAFATCSKTTYLGDETNGASFFQRTRAWVKRWPRNEFTPCATHTNHIFSYRKGNYWFLLVSWTAVLSSLTFIGQTDVLPVVGRFFASVIVCRMIVAYELRGMKVAVRIVEEEGEFGLISNSIPLANISGVKGKSK